MKRPSRSRGAYLVLMAILVVVVIAVAALILDVGRVLVLRSDMQAAADAAALAAAMELDGRSDTVERARMAARHLLNHDGRFARVRDLLGDGGLPDEAITFFCAIGAATDVDPSMPGFSSYCAGPQTEPGKVAIATPEEAHYVRVRLDSELAAEEGRYITDLIFLPVLRVFGGDTLRWVGLNAEALAGRNYFVCNFPPIAVCDPFEASGSRFRDRMTEGGHIELKQQGSNQWSSGNFGFLETRSGGTGADAVSDYLADANLTGCEPPRITTQTGGMTNKMKDAINVRFDEYGSAGGFKPATNPPAPNIMDYPLDNTTDMLDGRFGRGDWDFNSYWASNHPSRPAPNAWSNMNRPSRWEVYNWEIANNAIPAVGRPNPSHLYTGSYPPSPSNAERRMLHVAVVSCNAAGLTGGKKSTVVFAPDGFARIFLVSRASGPPNAIIYGEYVGWSGRGDSNYHVDVRLYE
jgi:hypothetical protein